jgi:hypothetical protein
MEWPRWPMRFVFVLPTIQLQLLIVIGALEVARGEDTRVLCEDILPDDIVVNRPSGQIQLKTGLQTPVYKHVYIPG